MKKSWSELTEAEINRNKRNTCESRQDADTHL